MFGLHLSCQSQLGVSWELGRRRKANFWSDSFLNRVRCEGHSVQVKDGAAVIMVGLVGAVLRCWWSRVQRKSRENHAVRAAAPLAVRLG